VIARVTAGTQGQGPKLTIHSIHPLNSETDDFNQITVHFSDAIHTVAKHSGFMTKKPEAALREQEEAKVWPLKIEHGSLVRDLLS
jgi:hypothetical protein